MSRRTRRTLLIVAAVLVLLAVAVFLRSKAPPEAARLLPESDGIIYINLRPVRTFLHKELKPPQRVPDYQQFVDATGIDWERDLDQAAIALHRMPDPNGPNGPVAYSMVLVGKITGQRLTPGSTRTPPRAKPTPATPSTASPPKAAPSAWRRSATTWWPSPTPPPRSRFTPCSTAIAPPRWPLSGSTLLQQHYHDVPLLSLAWGVGQIGLPFSESGAINIFGFALPLEADSTIVASVAPACRSDRLAAPAVEEIAPTETRPPARPLRWPRWSPWPAAFTAPLAQRRQQQPERTAETAEVTQNRDRVVVTATLPGSFLTGL